MSKLVYVESIREGLVGLVLNRPEKRNALSVELMRQFCGELDHLKARRDVRVVILRGEGPVFCAGLDLREATDAGLADHAARWMHRMLQRLRATSIVTICQMHGGAWAGGVGLLAACDIVVAADDAQFAFPEARRGLIPALISDVMRPRVLDGNLRELFLVGEPIDMIRAQQIGLVQRIVPQEKLSSAVLSIADAVLRGAPNTIRLTKTMLNDLEEVLVAPATERLIEAHLGSRESHEAKEGLAAFLQKRTPNWPK